MASRITQNTFAGGEITPALIARNDIQKYSSSLKTLRNGFIRQEGCVTNRSGLELVGEVKNSNKKVRLVPFVFNTEQSYIIEFGHLYCRFIKDGAYIVYGSTHEHSGETVEIVSPYTEDELSSLYWYQEYDTLKIVHPSHEPKMLQRYAHDDWRFASIQFTPSITAPTNVAAVFSGTTTSNTREYSYLVTAVDANTLEESDRSESATVIAHYESAWLQGEKVTVSWDAVTGACEYNIYKAVNGIFGYVGTSQNLSFIDTNIEPDMSDTAPIHQTPFANNNYPSVVSAYQQRNIYANSTNNPLTMWTTQLASNNNFNVSRPTVASDAITMTLSDNKASEIRHMIALDDLIVLTSSAEWKVTGSDGSFDASPPPKANIQSCYGSSKVKPVVSGSMILFVQSGGMVVRDLGYTYMSDSYDGDELTIFANHLFLGKEIIEADYAKEPFRILWVIQNDGSLLGLTYNKKQEHCGWHRHDSQNAKFESVAVIRENNEDIAYFVVNRTINNEQKRFVERMSSRLINNASDGFFLDCALKYESSTAVTTVSGLSHLNGEKVFALADGGVIENLTVKNGSVTLPYAAKKIVVGLPYTFEVETLNIEGENTHCIKKIVNKIDVKIFESREDFKCVNCDATTKTAPRSISSVNDSDLLFDTEVSFIPRNKYTSDATIHIIQDKPLPLTVAAISAVVNTGDVA